MDLSNNAEADSEMPQGSRDPSPVSGEDRRLGDSSHNGLSSAFTVGQGHRVGAGGSALEEENQSRGLLAGADSPPRLIGPAISEEVLPGYGEATADDHPMIMHDEGVDIDYAPANSGYPWETSGQPTWGFGRLGTQGMTVNSEEDAMFDDKGSSNDSTRVEGNAGSPAQSLMGEMEDLGEPIYSEPVTGDEYGNRSMRESAPPPEAPGANDDDEDELPVMELQADPAHDGELTFKPAAH